VKKSLLFVAAAVVCFASTLPAFADVDEIRVGAAHNLRLAHGDLVDGKEGNDLQAEAVFSSPDFLNILGSPRPYAVASWNTEGKTNFGGIGLLWRLRLSRHWAFEPGVGYVIHDGEVNNPFPPGDPRAISFEHHHQLLGSRDLFRTTFALENVLDDHSAWQIYYEHMSHGQIIGQGRNQGLDDVGVRYVWRFNPDPAR